MSPSSIDSSTPAGSLTWPAPRTFFGVPSVSIDALDAQVAFLGVPYDGGTPQPGNRTGQAEGPAAARRNSYEQLAYPEPGAAAQGGAEGWYDIEADREYLAGVTMADVGDVAIQGSDVEGNYARMTGAARRIAERGALMVAIGGDHSISFPLGRGMEPHGEIDVVHVDAHADFADHFDGARLTGGSQLRRLHELPFVGNVTALGLRNADRRLEAEPMRELGVGWATSLELIERGPEAVVAERVPESRALYVSIDIDVLDVSVVPGTTLPEPGGLDYRRLREALVAIARRGTVVGVDVVELNPPHDPSATTARLASWIATHFLSEIFEQPR
jgi:agmatinase